MASYHLEQEPDGSWVIIDDATGKAVVTDPFTGEVTGENPIPPNTPNITGNQSGTGMVNLSGGTGPFLPEGLKWLGALFLLWVILTALSEHGDPNAKNIGRALAGLILLGALFYLGPGAISNVKNLWTQTGTSSPVLGPNPVPGA